MKLLSFTNRYYFVSITVFILLAGIVLFYSIKYQLKKELDEQLIEEEAHVARSMKKLDSLNVTSLLLNDNLSFSKVSSGKFVKPVLFDSYLYDNIEHEFVPYRIIQFTANTQKLNYLVTIKSSEIENNDIIFSVFIGLMLVLALFSIMLYFSNYYFSRKLWEPFLKTITSIKGLNINTKELGLKFGHSTINEFNELNQSLEQMTKRIWSDYKRMKDFSENASHELQTPLTIIRSKLESLLQSRDLKASDARLIHQALENTVRLSRINQTLLLLTKIENGQYEQKQEVSFVKIFERYIEAYEELMVDRNLKITVDKTGDFIFPIHPALADILVSNLLNNAIKHNMNNGWLSINIYPNWFEIINSGIPAGLPTEQLFDRFTKGTNSNEHTGLGLALVKEIAEANGLQVKYDYINDYHIVKIFVPSN
jgi:Signal transduction histidine kinase